MISTKLQIVSDVHLEFYSKKSIPKLEKHADNLALLGDIGKPFMETYKMFLEMQSEKFSKVFVIMGNHEYYNGKKCVPEILDQAKKVCNEFHNVYLLDKETYDLTDKTTLLGCTLWSPANAYAVEGMNDFRKILVKWSRTSGTEEEWKLRKPITGQMYKTWHMEHVFWLEKEIEHCKKQGKNAVVLTHHAPLKEMGGKYIGSPLSSGYVSNLAHMFKPPVIAFANGHLHSNCDIMLNDIRCVSNSMGYPHEQDTGYKPDVVLEIP